MRREDGSAGDADYGLLSRNYTSYRRADVRIFELIERHLDGAETVLNVGAGAGSYEPQDRRVTAVEPSASMRKQRGPERVTAIDAVAERLPFADRSFDASMATFTVHQWGELKQGISEMRRVTKGPVLLLTCDPTRVEDFWLARYAPLVLRAESQRYPALQRLVGLFDGHAEVIDVPIPLDCTDGFNEAYYGRPEKLLEEGARLSNSAWSFVSAETQAQNVAALALSLKDGSWEEAYGQLRHQPTFDGSLRLIVGYPAER
jgi:hypothetical protein